MCVHVCARVSMHTCIPDAASHLEYPGSSAPCSFWFFPSPLFSVYPTVYVDSEPPLRTLSNWLTLIVSSNELAGPQTFFYLEGVRLKSREGLCRAGVLIPC